MSSLGSFCRQCFVVAFLLSSLLAVPPRLEAAEAQPAPAGVELLFVQTAAGAVVDLEQKRLTLTGLSPTTIFFSDRPFRLAGHYSSAEFLQLWGEGKDSFLSDPPNATLSVFVPGQTEPTELVLELMNPRQSGADMVYDIRLLQGEAPAASGPASLFIDIIGMPLTPMSYAGVARRWTRRAILY